MSRKTTIALASVLGLLIVGFFGFRYVTDSGEQAYATYEAPVEAGMTDEQRIFKLQSDLGDAASEMAQLQTMAKKLQFGKMKSMGRHLQEVADQLQPRLAEIEDRQAKKLLRQGIEGLRTVGEGSADLDPDKSMRGVNEVLTAFDQLNQRNAS